MSRVGCAAHLMIGDCRTVMAGMEPDSFDSIVCDPPYGLEFMGVAWDTFERPKGTPRTRTEWKDFGSREHARRPSEQARIHGNKARALYTFSLAWTIEALRVLKPGGLLVAFGGTRTFHRLTCAIEDAGFEIRDCLSWLYGCLSEDTELLTSEGWVRYNKASERQHALAFNPSTGEFAWEPITAVFRYQHDGEMVRLHSAKTDQLLTPNHRVVLDASAACATPYVRSEDDIDYLPGLRRSEMADERFSAKGQGGLLQFQVQRDGTRAGVGQARTQGGTGEDSGELYAGCCEDDRRSQSGVEGRSYRVQEARELCRRPVREGTRVGAADGPQGWLPDGAPSTDGCDVRLSVGADRGCQSREPRPERQSPVKPDTLAEQSGPQVVRMGEVSDWNLLPSTTVTASWVEYAGVVWCISVPSGAFVARRNGQIFVTGNSGFPKSLDVSKAIDSRKDWRALAALQSVVRAARMNLGISQSEAARRAGIIGTDEQLGGGGFMWFETGMRLPTREQYLKLKAALGLDNECDLAFEVAEREVLSRSSTTRSANGSWSSGVDSGMFQAGERDVVVTAPATDAAREWEGWGTALKPAWEPIILARKPLSEPNVAANVLRWGTGAVNVDGCRIGTDDGYHNNPVTQGVNTAQTSYEHRRERRTFVPASAGRWPANVVLDEAAAAAIDEQSGTLTSGANPTRRGTDIYAAFAGQEGCTPARGVDVGGASRFFYTAKASTSERNERLRPAGLKAIHPTVKPLELMRWLCRLVTLPGGHILDPFAGSGSTLVAALMEGFDATGIELSEEYAPLIRARIDGVQMGGLL